jgi:predicted aldo/keto reductase-like oxidoreductase
MTKFIGLSGHNRPGRFVDAIQRFKVDVLLNAVNFVDRHTYNFEGQVWAVANRLNLGLIAMKIFGGEQKSGVTGISHTLMPTSNLDLGFRYALSVPHVACAVVGMATQKELQDNLKRARAFSPLNSRESENLLKAGRLLAAQWGTHFGSLH